MTRLEFLSAMKDLSSYYLKTFDTSVVESWYEIFKEETEKTFNNAIKEIVTRSKYFPSVSELVEECKRQRTINGFAILDYMKSQGYFKESPYAISEYDKAYKWLEKGVIPEWFKEDMKKYNKQKKMLETKENKILIGG